MIQTAIYALLTSLLLGAGAHFAERIFGQFRWPRRATWSFAILASVSLSVAALIAEPHSRNVEIISLPGTFEILPEFIPAANEIATSLPEPRQWLSWPNWEQFDSGVAALWIGSTVTFLVILCVACIRLGRFTRRCEAQSIGKTQVLISDDIGPAVFGLLRPRIVLPRWIAVQNPGLRDVVLCHEREHLAAHDHWLLAAALLAVTVMPWNPAVWWQLKKLRVAIETDCDARVLSNGVDPRNYSRALLSVGQGQTRSPLGTVALTEPVSELELRITTMLQTTRQLSLAVIGSRMTLVFSLTALALLVNAPGAQPNPETDTSTTRSASPFVRSVVYEELRAAQNCIEADDIECAQQVLDSVDAMADLSTYETSQLYNFRAFVAFNADDTDGALGNYEALLGLPRDELPDGLIRSVMRNVASLHIQLENLQAGLDTFEDWMSLPFVEPESQDYYLKSTIHYQLEDYGMALEPLLQAIATAAEPVQSQYQLLYAINYERNDIDGAIATLEFINDQWPDNGWGTTALENLRNGIAPSGGGSETQ